MGYTGSVGTQGDLGYTGSVGTQGDLGYTGSAGVGYTGSAGTNGTNGFTGSAGVGYTGSASTVAGFTGSQGNIGFTGSSGGGGGGYAIITGDGTGTTTFDGSAWLTIPVDGLAEIVDSGGFAATTTNGFTLTAGTYDISVQLRGMNVRSTTASFVRMGIRLRNTTDNNDVDVYDLASEWDGIWESEAKRISFPPFELRGIITITGTCTFTVWMKPEDVNMDVFFSGVNGKSIKALIIKLA